MKFNKQDNLLSVNEALAGVFERIIHQIVKVLQITSSFKIRRLEISDSIPRISAHSTSIAHSSLTMLHKLRQEDHESPILVTPYSNIG